MGAARADGSGVRRLTTAPGPQLSPSFSPDGGLIAYLMIRKAALAALPALPAALGVATSRYLPGRSL
jgi:hypothetical protein